MLIGIPAILGPDLLFTLRSMGHGDEIALVDANYPAQEHARRLVRADGHGVMAILEAILKVMPLDRAVPNAILRAALNNDPTQSNASVLTLRVATSLISLKQSQYSLGSEIGIKRLREDPYTA